MAGMKFSILMAAGLPLIAPAMAGVKSGHAEAELLSGVASYQPGKAVPVGIRLKIDPGWHSYWINAGDAGMPMKATWTLPEGWKAGELRLPFPKRFSTGGLAGFGYEKEAVYLVDLIPPVGAAGDAECRVKLSWLTCNDSACVPGDVQLSLKVPAGDGAAGKDASAIAEAVKKIPVPAKDATLTVKEADGKISLSLAVPEGIDLTGVSANPATPQVIDNAADLIFEKKEGLWTTTAAKNEYAEGPATLLDIVLSGGKLAMPLTVSWRAGK